MTDRDAVLALGIALGVLALAAIGGRRLRAFWRLP